MVKPPRKACSVLGAANEPPRNRFRTADGRFLALVMLGCCLLGCADRSAQVRGTVTLPDNTPAVGVTVVFEDLVNQVRAAGETDEQGAFELTSSTSSGGLAPGDYVVTVHPAYAADSSAAQPEQRFPARYLRSGRSGLACQVQAGLNQYDIALQSR